MEEKASGIDVEQTDLDSLLEEILEWEKEAKKDLESKDRDKKSKVEKEKATAEEVRKRALERIAKPKVEVQENKQKKPKVRRNTAEAIDYLRERSDNETDYRKQELEVRRREMELQSEKQDQAHKQQQAMFTALMVQMQMQQQSQQSMQALLATQRINKPSFWRHSLKTRRRNELLILVHGCE